MLLCTWLERSFRTATKILGDFLKWLYFGQEAKVNHCYYDLYVFVKKMCCFYQYCYTCPASGIGIYEFLMRLYI